VRVSMHVVCVCVVCATDTTLHYIRVSQVLQKGLEVATENRSNRVRNVCLSCRSSMQLLRPHVFHCSHSTILGGPEATRLQGSCLWTHTSIQGRPPPHVQFPFPPTHAHIYIHRYINNIILCWQCSLASEQHSIYADAPVSNCGMSVAVLLLPPSTSCTAPPPWLPRSSTCL